MDETKQTVCRECEKSYEAKIEYYVPQRGSSKGRRVPRVFGWCTRACYRKYYDRVRQRSF